VTRLELPDLLLVAGRVVGVDLGELPAVADLDAAAAVLAAAGRAEEPARSAAVLLAGLATVRPFGERSVEVGLVAALQLLALNGRRAGDLGPPEAVRTLLARAALGAAGVDELTAWLRRAVEEEAGAMFERFTSRARRAVVLAQEEARRLRHAHIGTEHLLLGLLSEGEGVAAKALEALGVSLDAARARVEAIIGRGTDDPVGHVPFTPRAKKVLELSLREAKQYHHRHLGTEHLLLGLVREGEGVGAQVLDALGADARSVRQQVLQLLASPAHLGGALEGRDDDEDLESDTVAVVGGLFQENRRLRAEVRRLRELLRRHGVEPDGGESRTA
jgi:hypothetical protein